MQTPRRRQTGRALSAQFAGRPVSIMERVLSTDADDKGESRRQRSVRQLTGPYRRELQVHCYRMLGSFQDAEDALQDTLLAAWQGLGGFEGRASIRTWLYRIATNRCLNTRRSASRRSAKEWDVPDVEPPEPTGFGEVVWLEPFPDALLEGSGRRAARAGGPLPTDRSDLPGLRDRPSGPAASPARRPHFARRPRIPRERGGRHARLDRRIGQQRPQTGPRQLCGAGCRRRRSANRLPLPTRLPSKRSWRSSSARGSPPISTRW